MVKGAHIPLEVGRDGEVHFDDGAGDGLHAGRQLQARELVDQLVHRLAQPAGSEVKHGETPA